MNKNGMQYIVVQGRTPQDGSKALEALVIFPAWVSPTLVCAGMSGRVIELTDGSIKQQGALPYGESEVLAGLAIGVAPLAEPTANIPPICEDAYREGIQAERDRLIKWLEDKGHTKPSTMAPAEWLLAAMEAYKEANTPTDAAVEDTYREDHMQRALDQRDQEIERLRLLLAGIRRLAKKGKA